MDWCSNELVFFLAPSIKNLLLIFFTNFRKTPEEPNGIILQYTVYMKELARSRDVAPRSHKVNALQMSHQVDNLNANAR